MDPILESEDLALVLTDDELIDAATGEIRAACGWHVAPSVTHTLTVESSGSRLLILPTLRLTAVTAVRVDGQDLVSSGYTWRESGLITRRGGSWPSAPAVIEADVTHGWQPDEVPHIKGLIAAMVTRVKATKNGLIVRAQAGQVSRTYSQVASNQAAGLSLTEHERTNVLAPYRLQQTP